MRTCCLVVLALVTGSTLQAQTPNRIPTRADIIGRWVNRVGRTSKGIYDFNADSTFVHRIVRHVSKDSSLAGVELDMMKSTGRWRLAGDTLVFTGKKAVLIAANGQEQPLSNSDTAETQLVQFAGARLIITTIGPVSVYKRDSAAAEVVSTGGAVQGQAVRWADLVGR